MLYHLQGSLYSRGPLLALVVETETDILQYRPHAVVHRLPETLHLFLKMLLLLKAHPLLKQHPQNCQIIDDFLGRGIEAELL